MKPIRVWILQLSFMELISLEFLPVTVTCTPRQGDTHPDLWNETTPTKGIGRSFTSIVYYPQTGHPCLVSNLKGNVCSSCPLSMMLAVDLPYMVFIMFSYVPCIHTLLRGFITNRFWILFYQMLFLHLFV